MKEVKPKEGIQEARQGRISKSLINLDLKFTSLVSTGGKYICFSQYNLVFLKKKNFLQPLKTVPMRKNEKNSY